MTTWVERAERRLRLRDLEVFQAVAAHGTMSRAAVALSVSQSAISKTIGGLEATLGVPLFERSAHGVVATDYARKLLARSGAIFDELRQGLLEIDFLRNPAGGELRIGTTEPMMPVAAMVIDRLLNDYPRARFDVVANETTSLLRNLRERRIELVLSRFPVAPLDPVFVGSILFRDPLVVVAGRDSRWATRRAVRLDQLMDERWILPPDDAFLRASVEEAFVAAGLTVPHIAVSSTSTFLRTVLLGSGPWLTMLPRAMIRLIGRRMGLVALPIDLEVTGRPIGLISLAGRVPGPVARIFADEAKAATHRLERAGRWT